MQTWDFSTTFNWTFPVFPLNFANNYLTFFLFILRMAIKHIYLAKVETNLLQRGSEKILKFWRNKVYSLQSLDADKRGDLFGSKSCKGILFKAPWQLQILPYVLISRRNSLTLTSLGKIVYWTKTSITESLNRRCSMQIVLNYITITYS